MGSGSCSFHAPATFDLDEDDGKVTVLGTRDPEANIRAAADSCPTRAITLIAKTAGPLGTAGEINDAAG